MIKNEMKNEKWKFFKLTKTHNYREWNRNMTNTFQIANLWKFIIDTTSRLVKKNETFLYEKFKTFTIKKKIYFIKYYKTRNRIIYICMSIIQIMIKVDIIDFKKIWNFFKKRFQFTK